MFSLKILDLDPLNSAVEILGFAKANPDVGVEITNYLGNDYPGLTERFLVLPDRQKAIHLNQNAYCLTDLAGPEAHAALARLSRELDFMADRRIGGGAVTHVMRDAFIEHHDYATTGIRRPMPFLPDLYEAIRGLHAALSITLLRTTLFIENSFENIAWFRKFFDLVHIAGYPEHAVGFCLDFGHARVWGGQPIKDWLVFCQDLAATGHPIHSHAHFNSGADDEHLPLVDAMGCGLLDPHPFYCPQGLVPLLQCAAGICGREHFVFENAFVPRGFDNLAWARRTIG